MSKEDAGFLNADWGSKGGQCYECWKLEPCCGSPCNPQDGLYCLITWWCCGICNFSQLYASSLDQDCAIVNHCVVAYCFSICAATATRYNIRAKYGIGGKTTKELIGDFCCVYCCGPCSACQELRAVEKKDWDFIGAVRGGKKVQVMAPFKMLRD